MAKFKATNIDTWGVDVEPQGVASRFASSDSKKEAARRLLDEMENKRHAVEAQYEKSNTRFANKQKSDYDFEARMQPTRHAGYESDFSAVRSEEDFEQMNAYASNNKSIKRSGYEQSNEGRENITDLAHKYFYSQGSGIFHDPEVLESILVEKEHKRQAIAESKSKRELKAETSRTEAMSRHQSRIDEMFDEDSPLEGWTTAELSKSRIRKTANEATSSSAFGILNEDKLSRMEEIKGRLKEAKQVTQKTIKRASVSPEEKRAAWENYEAQRSSTMQDRFSDSPVIRSLSKTME